MRNFWQGFVKEALRGLPSQQPPTQPGQQPAWSPGATAAGVGAGVTGLGAAGMSLGNIRRDIQDRKVKKTRSLKDFHKKLQPGDILFVRGPKKFVEERVKLPSGKTAPVTNADLAQLIHGDPYYHASIYRGKGDLSEAIGLGEKAQGGKLHRYRGQSVKAYRPTGASTKEVQEAIDYASKVRGTKYPTTKELVSFGAQSALGVGKGSQCARKGGGPVVCTGVATRAYPEQFKRETMGPADMRRVKGMELVGRYGNTNPRLGVKEKVISRIIHPTLRNLKWGLGAAGLTYGAVKAKQFLDAQRAKKNAGMLPGVTPAV